MDSKSCLYQHFISDFTIQAHHNIGRIFLIYRISRFRNCRFKPSLTDNINRLATIHIVHVVNCRQSSCVNGLKRRFQLALITQKLLDHLWCTHTVIRHKKIGNLTLLQLLNEGFSLRNAVLPLVNSSI